MFSHFYFTVLCKSLCWLWTIENSYIATSHETRVSH